MMVAIFPPGDGLLEAVFFFTFVQAETILSTIFQYVQTVSCFERGGGCEASNWLTDNGSYPGHVVRGGLLGTLLCGSAGGD
jgi:hypothetical protein